MDAAESPLSCATFDELIEEISRRTSACCVGYEMDDGECTRMDFTSRGTAATCVGLATLMQQSMLRDIMGGQYRPRDDDQEEE
jgi:hypothetical protein